MPMPTGGPWPPPSLRKALDQFRVWDAWWAGDPDQLAEVYGGRYSGGPNNRPAQYRGGVQGFLARMWWGRPTPANETEEKLHVPLAGDLCRMSADLLFTEPLKVTSPDAAVAERLEELFDEAGQAKLIEAAETIAALGGGYLRPVYDKTVSDRAWLDCVAPDAALPTWRWGRLSEVTFWRQVAADDKWVWRHLEHHTPGRIEHALYRGTGDELGRVVPLTDVPPTAGLADMVDEDGAVETGYPGLDVTYIPHLLPNRAWRRDPMLAPMGRSVLDGCEGMLDALDMTYSAWMRDVDLGKGRVIVPETWLDDLGPGKGASFDPNRKWFATVPGALNMDTPTIVQFAIRVQEHRDTCDDLIGQIMRHAGFAEQTFGEQGNTAATATEVVARERLSFITRGRQIGYWKPQLVTHTIPALLAVDAYAFGRPLPAELDIEVEFADSVQEDIATIAQTANLLGQAQAASIETRVRMVHPDWSDDQVAAEVALIRDDTAAAMPAPFDYGTGPTESGDQRAALDDTATGQGGGDVAA